MPKCKVDVRKTEKLNTFTFQMNIDIKTSLLKNQLYYIELSSSGNERNFFWVWLFFFLLEHRVQRWRNFIHLKLSLKKQKTTTNKHCFTVSMSALKNSQENSKIIQKTPFSKSWYSLAQNYKLTINSHKNQLLVQFNVLTLH